jgi:hypothetical protein
VSRRRRSRTLLALCLTGFFLGAGECALRIFESLGEQQELEEDTSAWRGMLVDDADPILRYRNMPSVQRSAAGASYGHDVRGHREPAAAAAADVPAVAFLGDSTTYGFGVDAEETVPQLLAEFLGDRVSAINLGVCGFGTAQEVALYKRDREHLLGCKFVVLAVYPNDFWPLSYFWDESSAELYHDPMPLPRAWTANLRHSALYRALVSLVTPSELRVAEARRPAPQNIDHVLRGIEALAALVHSDGRQLVVVNLPSMERLDPYRHSEYVDQVEAKCDQLQLPYADLLQGFLKEREQHQIRFSARTGRAPTEAQRAWFLARYWVVPGVDPHLDVAGNRIVAEQLARLLGPLLGI